MCTYLIYSNPGTATPLLMATTRDENPLRKTLPAFLWDKPELFSKPAGIGTIKLHFLERRGINKYLDAEIIAPQDVLLGGTFLAQNRHGVIAAVNNREHSPFNDHKLERLPGRDSGLRKMPRGGLPFDALSFDNAEEAAREVYAAVVNNQRNNQERKYSGFNLVIADTKSAWVVTNAKAGDITVDNETRVDYEDVNQFSLALWKLTPGVTSMLAGFDVDDFARSAKTQNHLPAIRNLPLPTNGDFSSWHPWLNRMAYRNEYRDNPFGKSICQPNPKNLKTINVGIPGWVTIATHLMVVDNLSSSWYGIEGQLLHGTLMMQEIDRAHPNNWSSVIFSDDTLREYAGKKPPAIAV